MSLSKQQKTSHLLNPTRKLAYDCFILTLKKALNQKISEQEFCKAWFAEAQKYDNLHAEGWYEPPSGGVSVLSADENNPKRISFQSLRDEEFWPSDRFLAWKNGFLFFYCSPICKQTGRIADLALTLYFGESERIRQHFQNAYRATQEVIYSLKPNASSREIFVRANKIFYEHRLENKTYSYTDQGRPDLGHSFPSLPGSFSSLSNEQKSRLSQKRRFLHDASDWPLSDVAQFSIEPQLRSLDDPTLPQVCLHILVSLQGGRLLVQRDVQDLLHVHGLV